MKSISTPDYTVSDTGEDIDVIEIEGDPNNIYIIDEVHHFAEEDLLDNKVRPKTPCCSSQVIVWTTVKFLA